MATILEIDDSYEQVQCPVCKHKWYEKKVFAYGGLFNSISCFNCGARLRSPTCDVKEGI